MHAGEAPEPPIGAHLITPRRGYTHHGIYAGQGSVLHYAGLARDLRPGPVEEVSLERFANGRPVHIECRSTPALDEQDIVSRARSRLGENRYRLLTNNCEHFSEWSRFGASRSHQVERWLGSAPSAAPFFVAWRVPALPLARLGLSRISHSLNAATADQRALLSMFLQRMAGGQ
jgi:hypothetical protein